MLALVVPALDLFATARGQDPHPLDQWALRYTRPSGQPLAGAAYGDGVYMAVGSGTLLTSFDAVDWTETSQGTSTLTDVLFANHRFTVIGGQALIFGNTDVGALITSNAPPATTNVPINFSCVAYANGAFLALTASGTILQSGQLSPPSVAPRFTSSPVSVLADGTVALWLIVPAPGLIILECHKRVSVLLLDLDASAGSWASQALRVRVRAHAARNRLGASQIFLIVEADTKGARNLFRPRHGQSRWKRTKVRAPKNLRCARTPRGIGLLA